MGTYFTIVDFFIFNLIQCCPCEPSLSQYVSGSPSVMFSAPSSSYSIHNDKNGHSLVLLINMKKDECLEIEWYQGRNIKMLFENMVVKHTKFYNTVGSIVYILHFNYLDRG